MTSVSLSTKVTALSHNTSFRNFIHLENVQYVLQGSTWQLKGLPGTSSPLNRKSTVWTIGSRGVKDIAYVCGPWAWADVGTRPPFTVTSKFPGPAWLVSTKVKIKCATYTS